MVATRILTIESTCDETAAAVVTDGLDVLSSVIASQEDLHRKFDGVVPEIAARAHVERILPVIDCALKKANLSLKQIDAIAVANTPGLSGSLLIGLAAAKSLCMAAKIPLISINHLHAHVYACQLDVQENIFPCIGMIISGGHSHLYDCENALDFRYLGGTIDDAAGEAFDKVATMLGLPYPGGPSISKAALTGNPQAYKFPRSFIHEDRLDFSFSGLKTAVRYTVAGQGKPDFTNLGLSDEMIADVAASFQHAVVDVLVAKAFQAIRETQRHILCVGGGVAANRVLRTALENRAVEDGVRLHIAPLQLCTDNAVMGAIAVEKYRAGIFEPLDLDIEPGLVRG